MRRTLWLDLRENQPIIANHLKLQRLYGLVNRRNDPCEDTQS